MGWVKGEAKVTNNLFFYLPGQKIMTGMVGRQK
jgi:hypothetical protein